MCFLPAVVKISGVIDLMPNEVLISEGKKLGPD